MAERPRVEVTRAVLITVEMANAIDALALEEQVTRSHLLREIVRAGLPVVAADAARRRAERERLAVPA